MDNYVELHSILPPRYTEPRYTENLLYVLETRKGFVSPNILSLERVTREYLCSRYYHCKRCNGIEGRRDKHSQLGKTDEKEVSEADNCSPV